ncbi:MAG: ATP-binding cassette domain-containing protein [Alphaproteobacteria bacterium]|nr:ATP-binding cassette domain-containing protein [Alphaproteobacteria bacterium]
MAAPPLLSISDIGVNLGDRWLLRHVDLSLSAGDRLALVGRNGAGKSSLMKLIAGSQEPDEGSRWVAPGVQVAYLPQTPTFSGSMSLASYVIQGLKNEPENGPENGLGRDENISDSMHRADAMLMRMNMDPARMTDGLSGGERRRVSLARALVTNPDILLLDEPTNHLDLPTIEWLEGLLKERGGALVLISHDRAFLRSLGNGIIWINQGNLRRREGAFEQFEDWSEGIMTEESVRLRKLDKRIADETRWSHQGISARRKRNQGRMRELAELRVQRIRDGGSMSRQMSMTTGNAEGGGQVVLEARNITITVPGAIPQDEPHMLVSHFNAIVKRGDRLGIVGPNGAGKSTLLRVMLGEMEPSAGHVKIGFGLLPAYFDQNRTQLNPDANPWTTLCPDGGESVEVGGKPRHVTSYLRDFLFDDHKMTQRVGTLSGGEQNRLMLARIFAQPHNFLVLDEPTNDLDLESIDLLQEVVADYDGTVMIVSHDRDFLDRTVSGVLAFEEQGRITPHAGGYSDYLSRRTALAKADSKQRKAKKKPAQEKPSGPQKERLSYKQTYLLKTLPEEMSRLEAAIATAAEKLGDMTFFAKDPDAYQALSAQMDADNTAFCEAEEMWLELEILRETIEDNPF